MEQRRLGTGGLVVSALGLGCMGMSWAYGKPDEAESIASCSVAIDSASDLHGAAPPWNGRSRRVRPRSRLHGDELGLREPRRSRVDRLVQRRDRLGFRSAWSSPALEREVSSCPPSVSATWG